MYTGHFAAALALKARTPKTPSWALFVGVCLLDFLWAFFVTFGIEVWRKDDVQIAWSHSLVAALVWSALFAAFFVRKGWAVTFSIAAAVFSHFVLDWPVHAAHLQFYPYSSARFGLNLGQTAWCAGWWLELGVILAASGYYLLQSRKDASFGRHASAAVALLVALHFLRAVLNL